MTNKTDAWMPLWIGSYLADTQRLTRDQHGGYLLLIMDYWRNGPPPDDDEVLRAITKATPAEWKKLRPALVGFFRLVDGKWNHKRIDQELADSMSRKAKAGSKAKAAAEARWKQGRGNASGNAPGNAPSIPTSSPQAMHKECPTPSPIRNSVPNGTGGQPPPDPGEVDPTKAIFDLGVSVLTAVGQKDSAARSLVGKLRKAVGDDRAMTVLVAAKSATNPAEYIGAAIRPDPVADSIRERTGAKVEKLPDGTYRSAGRTFNADGSGRVALC